MGALLTVLIIAAAIWLVFFAVGSITIGDFSEAASVATGIVIFFAFVAAVVFGAVLLIGWADHV